MDSQSVSPLKENARRILWLRAIAMPAPAAVLVLASLVYAIPAPLTQLLIIIGVLILVDTWTWWRLRQPRPFGSGAFFVQMLIDIVALTGTLYYTGGASNPFALFFLLPVMITATVLPKAYTWAIVGISILCYTGLMISARPLAVLQPGNSQEIFDLHVVGMWLGFVLISVLVAHFVANMGTTLRASDRRLARLREQALQDEQLRSLATLAAGAAHEISTPLNTMRLIVEEIHGDLPSEGFSGIHDQLRTLQEQIDRCKDALSVVSKSAGTGQSADLRAERPEDFLARITSRLRNLRPDTRLELELTGPRPGPLLAIERTLDQAMTNLIDNALDVSPRDVRIEGDWDEQCLQIRVLDRGPGPEQIDTPTNPGDGLGVGLIITRAIIDQLDGRLEFEARTGGGTIAIVMLPLNRLHAHG